LTYRFWDSSTTAARLVWKKLQKLRGEPPAFLAVAEGSQEDKASRTAFLRHLKERQLKGIRLFVSDRAAARQKAELVAAKLGEMKLADAAALVAAGIEETLYYYVFPRKHWRCLRTSNPLERTLLEV
jgi:transposase-like protein